MTDSVARYKIHNNIDHYLAVLSKLYGNEGQVQLQEILVNAQIRVHEEWTQDRWNGGTYGHAIFLMVPESIFIKSARHETGIQDHIKDDLNKICKIPDEFIAEVFLEMAPVGDQDWRSESGLLLDRKRIVPVESQQRIWNENGYKVFLSHKTEVKQETAALKDSLLIYGVSCFVAHEDIHPTKAWQDEIENALSTMDAMVALLTDKFHESLWTDQEVGYALGRDVPIIAVRLGRDPYGFIGKFQALSCKWEEAPLEIAKLLIHENGYLDAYIESVSNCKSWNMANDQARLLSHIDKLSDSQAQLLCDAFNQNSELNGSHGFKGNYPSAYGSGLADHLTRITGKCYQRTKNEIRREQA